MLDSETLEMLGLSKDELQEKIIDDGVDANYLSTFAVETTPPSPSPTPADKKVVQPVDDPRVVREWKRNTVGAGSADRYQLLSDGSGRWVWSLSYGVPITLPESFFTQNPGEFIQTFPSPSPVKEDGWVIPGGVKKISAYIDGEIVSGWKADGCDTGIRAVSYSVSGGINALAEALRTMVMPVVTSPEAIVVLKDAEKAIQYLSKEIYEKARGL